MTQMKTFAYLSVLIAAASKTYIRGTHTHHLVYY